MAAHSLSIAKASFSASLLRPDATKVSRDDFNQFHGMFEAVTTGCSRKALQICKRWLLENVIVSLQRSAAFAKFLVSSSRHTEHKHTGVSLSRHRLHIIYLLNDLLHHTKYHCSSPDLHSHLLDSLKPTVIDLFSLCASEAKSGIQARIQRVVTIWGEEGYYEPQTFEKIVKASLGATSIDGHSLAVISGQTPKEATYTMPVSHGDPNTPFYDLPAGNFMPHIIPNSRAPMQPNQIRALKFVAGPADDSLVRAVKDFLRDVDTIDNAFKWADEDGPMNMDELGQVSYQDEADQTTGDTYYGWSRAFCEKMKNRQVGQRSQIQRYRSSSSGHSSDQSRSRSVSLDRNGRKRKYRSEDSEEFGQAIGAIRSGDQLRADRQTDNNSTRVSETNRPLSTSMIGDQLPTSSNQRPRPTYSMPPPLPSLPGHHSVTQLQLGSYGVPIPPPPPSRPPNWQGPWPPPPPLPPSIAPFPNINHGFQMMPFSTPPPPPPPYSTPGSLQGPYYGNN